MESTDNFYRKMGYRLKELRSLKGLTQSETASKLGIKRTTLSQIENGERKVSAGDAAEFAVLFDIPLGVLFGIDEDMEVLLEKRKGKPGKRRQPMRISVPQGKVDKFKEVLLYILNKVGSMPNIGETVIYKILYFIDFDFYEKYEEQLIGATYIKNRYGPTPKEFAPIIKDMEKNKELETVKSKYFNYPQTKYLPRRKPDLSKFSAREMKLIDDVINRLADMNARAISSYSHNDIPWLTAEDGEIIDYESVFYRTPEYSVAEEEPEKWQP